MENPLIRKKDILKLNWIVTTQICIYKFKEVKEKFITGNMKKY